MPELIDKYATMGAIPAPTDAFEAEYYGKICDAIEAMPTIEAEPVRHGRWIAVPSAHDTRIAKCSLCGFWQKSKGNDKTGGYMIHKAVYRYCSMCGARMDGGTGNGKET